MLAAHSDRDRLFPHFWDSAEFLISVLLARLGADDEDAEIMLADLMRRFRAIEPVMPPDLETTFDSCFAVVALEAVTAEQRLFAARTGRPAGRTVGDDWPPIRVTVTHPFLVSVQGVARQLEAEANAAERWRKVN